MLTSKQVSDVRCTRLFAAPSLGGHQCTRCNSQLKGADDPQVLGWDVERVKPLILGPEGSGITMTFQRVGNLVHGKRGFDVSMTRCVIEDANARMPAPRAFETASRA